jgi:hypothetical protein
MSKTKTTMVREATLAHYAIEWTRGLENPAAHDLDTFLAGVYTAALMEKKMRVSGAAMECVADSFKRALRRAGIPVSRGLDK